MYNMIMMILKCTTKCLGTSCDHFPEKNLRLEMDLSALITLETIVFPMLKIKYKSHVNQDLLSAQPFRTIKGVCVLIKTLPGVHYAALVHVVCVCVCLSVNKISQKVFNQSTYNNNNMQFLNSAFPGRS